MIDQSHPYIFCQKPPDTDVFLLPFPADDEHVWHHDGDPSGAAQEPEHEDVAGAHNCVGPYF